MRFIKNFPQNIFLVCLTIAGTYGVSYISTFLYDSLFSNNFSSVLVFIILYILLYNTYRNLSSLPNLAMRKKRVCFALLTAFLFALFLILGYQLRANGMTDGGFKGKGLILLHSLLLSLAILPFSNYLFRWAEKIRNFAHSTSSKNWRASKVFFISWGIMFLAWIPVLLAYYPAVMSFDFHRQSQEAMKGFVHFNPFQPLVHTWLIWLSFQVGNILGSLETGMLFYSILQMLILSVSCAYSCNLMYRLLKRKWPVIVTCIFFACFPYISIFSVTATKDVIFSALFLIFVCLFIERTFLASGRKQLIIDIIWVIEGIIMTLFRNNALYAIVFFSIFYLFMGLRKQRVRILVLMLCLILGGKGASEGIQLLLGTVIEGNAVEMFSVPIQQFGRLGFLHGYDLDDDIQILVDIYVPEEIWADYNPTISDALKGEIGMYTFPHTWEGHYPQLFSDWIKAGLRYPNEYIDAFLSLTAGYWSFVDKTWAEVLGYGIEERMGALYTFNSTVSDVIPEGIAHVSKFPWLEAQLEKIVSGNSFYDWPILSNLFKPALYCWIMFLLLILCFYNYNRQKILTLLIPLTYFATLLLGPVVQIRYVLQFILLAPLLIALFVHRVPKQ